MDRYLGKNIISLGLYFGETNKGDDVPPSRSEPDERYSRWVLHLARIQRIYESINLLVRFFGQVTPDRLLPMEQVIIGGYGTVRGYEPSILIGDSGYVFSTEFLFAPPFIGKKYLFGERISQMVQFAVFFDTGGVYISDPLPGEDERESLTGYGVGLRLYYKENFSFKFDVGFPTEKKFDKKETQCYFSFSYNLF